MCWICHTHKLCESPKNVSFIKDDHVHCPNDDHDEDDDHDYDQLAEQSTMMLDMELINHTDDGDEI